MNNLSFLNHIERQITRLESERGKLAEQITCLRQFMRANNTRPKSHTKTPKGQAQIRLTEHMGKSGPTTSRDAAIALGMPFGTVSARLSKMRQEGLVKKESNGKWRLEKSSPST